MNLYMHHGRLDPSGPGTDEDGNPVDDWGFEGPRFGGVIGFHCTYGFDGHFNIWFESIEACDAAQRVTGWNYFDDCALTVAVEENCLRIWNREKQRHEYFGDWGIK